MDVKPALLSALDTEYEKNPFEVYCSCHNAASLFLVCGLLNVIIYHLSGCFCSSKEDC